VDVVLESDATASFFADSVLEVAVEVVESLAGFAAAVSDAATAGYSTTSD
jgi:hypothetical protein